jgi:calcium-dependent protein kinase
MEVIAHTMSPESIKHLRESFQKADKDQSGELTMPEFKEILDKNSTFTHEEVEKVFEMIDMDGTGRIRYREFIAATLDKKTITETNLQIAFEKISRRNGFIEAHDLEDLLGQEGTQEYVEGLLKEVGLTRQAKIDYAHFSSIMRGEKHANHLDTPLHNHHEALTHCL